MQLPCPSLPDPRLSAALAVDDTAADAVARASGSRVAPRRTSGWSVRRCVGLCRVLGLALALAGLLVPGHAVRAAPPPAVSPIAPATAAAAADVAALAEMAQSWLAGRLDQPPASLQVQAPDARWRRPPCRQALQFDLPFPGSTTTLRARCAEPVWQVYLRASGPGLQGAPGAGMGAAPGMADAGLSPHAAAAPATLAATSAATPAWRTVLVAAQPLRRGQVLSAELIQPGQRPAREVDATALSDLRQPGDHELVRDLAPGEMLRAADLRPALMVRRGQVVWLRVGEGTGFVVSARVEALQDGRLGEPVTLRNPDSGQTVSGVVVGPQAVRGGAR